MRLFWLVYKNGKNVEVFLQPAHGLIWARLMSLLAGQEGEFREGHELDRKTERKIPKSMRGRTLNKKEAAALLKKIAR